MLSNRFTIFLLFAILSLAFFLRVYQLDKHGIFYDEKASLLVSQGMAMEGNTQKNCFYTKGKITFTPKEFWAKKGLEDYYDAIRRSDIGNSPAYYVVLHTWIKIFGLNDFSLRFLSVLFSIATIILLFIFINTHFKNAILGLISCFLMAIEPFFIAVSQQARNYSMSFFLTLLATHIFLKIIKNEEDNVKKNALYWIYGLLAGLCLLSHFLTATVFLAHGMYVLLFVRKTRPWVLLPLALSIGGIFFGYWILFGGGNYTFQTLSYQAKIYYQEAHAVPNLHAGFIDPATVRNVTKKGLPIFADLFIVSNGLVNAMVGKKNLILAIIISLISVISVIRFQKDKNILWVGVLIGVNLLGFIAYSTSKWQYLELVNCGILLYLFIDYWRKNREESIKKYVIFMLILALLPTIFLVIMTFKNGHTFGLTQRYSGFSFPYAIILIGITLIQASRLKPLNYVIWGIFAIHLYFVAMTTKDVLNDVSMKYNYRDKARNENPYPIIAQKLIGQYQQGDTIVYPSYTKIIFEADIYTKNIKKSFLDAQYVNLYLPHDAEYVQTINVFEPNKILLKKTNGTSIEIFDFKGDTFRY